MDSQSLKLFGTGLLAGAIITTLAHKLLSSKGSKQQGQVQKPVIPLCGKEQQKSKNYEHDKDYQHLKEEQLARIIKFFGEEKFKKMENSFVIVFGVGGVGSHVVNMLARSGVKKIRIIDFDTVSLSSLNRHSFAVREDVGTLKVACLKKYIQKIFPHITIQCINTYATVQNVRYLLEGDFEKALSLLQKKQPLSESYSTTVIPDYIVDCIDNLDAKVELISACLQKKLKLIVSGGAGMKNDPTKIQIRDVSDCKYDKLIMRIKRQLTKKDIKSGFKVVFSYQQAERELLPLTQAQEKNPQAFKVFDNYRIRIVPVLGTMPAMIGMAIASYVLCDLAEEPYEPFETDYVKSSAIGKLFNELQYQLKKRGCSLQRLQVDVEQVSILAKKVYNWKCLISPDKKGDRLALWDKTKPATIDNLALMTKQHCDRHMKSLTLQQLQYPAQVIQRFNEKSTYAKNLMNSGFMMFT